MAFPDIEPNDVTITHQTPTVVNTARSGRQTRFQRSDPNYTIQYNFDSLSNAQRRQIIGHHASVGGSLNSFELQLPTGIKDNSAGYTGTITTSGTNAAGDNTIDYTATADGLALKAGDLITFDGYNKMYMVTADETVVSGVGILGIYPALLEDIPTSTEIIHTDVTATVFYQSTDLGYSMGPNQYASLSITFKEDL